MKRGGRVPILGLLAFAFVFLSACSPFYVVRAAYEQGRILAGRRAIEDVINDQDTSEVDRQKLKLVLAARAYASEIGLTPGNSFTSYSDVGKEALAWVVVGARKDSFALHTWWFPIVGTVPYKGFFDKADADAEARSLERSGYEASVRDTDAFSTLGWFDDPILSTTLQSPPTRIANTVIHESVHATVWIKNNVAFNESLANFVGTQATVDFFAQRLRSCIEGKVEGCDVARAREQAVLTDRERMFELATTVSELYKALDSLYKDPALASEEKIARRGAVFEAIVQPLRVRYPSLSILKQVHNAEVVQLMLYTTELGNFRALFEQCKGDWRAFMNEIRAIAKEVEQGGSVDPFVVLRKKTGGSV